MGVILFLIPFLFLGFAFRRIFLDHQQSRQWLKSFAASLTQGYKDDHRDTTRVNISVYSKRFWALPLYRLSADASFKELSNSVRRLVLIRSIRDGALKAEAPSGFSVVVH